MKDISEALKELERLKLKNLLEIYDLRYENEILRNDIDRAIKDRRNQKLREKRYREKQSKLKLVV